MKILRILFLSIITILIAIGGYYFTHKETATKLYQQEKAKFFANQELVSKLGRYLNITKQLFTNNLNFKDTNVDVFYVRQLVAEDNTTQRTIMFSANSKQPYSIEYQKKNNFFGSGKIIKATDVSFKDGKNNYIQYTVKLDNLEPNTKYEYRIITNDKKGTWHNLETDDKQEFTALIFADSQSANYSNWNKIASKAYSENSNAKLYLNLGDQVDNGELKYHWEQWLNGIEKYSADIPMATLIGNHELYDANWQERFPVVHKNLFNFPAPVEKYKNQFYSFDYGNVHFVALDTNHRDEMVPYQPYLAGAQFSWLRQDLAKSKAKWKVVMMHRDICMYGYSKESGYPRNWGTYFDYSGQDFMPIFEQYGVDAVLSGHLHTYRRRVPIKNFRANNKGVTYIMTGVSGDQGKESLWEDFALDEKRSPLKGDASNYMTMTASKDSLIFRAFLPNGDKFDEVVLKK